jgi:hypothetical protein
MNRQVLLTLLVASISLTLASCATSGVSSDELACNYQEALIACEEERREELFEGGYLGDEVLPKCEEVVPRCED